MENSFYQDIAYVNPILHLSLVVTVTKKTQSLRVIIINID